MKRLSYYFIIFSVATLFFVDASAAAFDRCNGEVRVPISNFVAGVEAILTASNKAYEPCAEDIIGFLTSTEHDKATVRRLVEDYRRSSTYVRRSPQQCQFCGTYAQNLKNHRLSEKCKKIQLAVKIDE